MTEQPYPQDESPYLRVVGAELYATISSSVKTVLGTKKTKTANSHATKHRKQSQFRKQANIKR